MNGANLSRAHLTIANLFWASANATDWTSSQILRVNFHQASLAGAKFNKALVTETVFAGTNLAGADFSEMRSTRNVFADCDMNHVKGLGSVRHAGPSFVSIDTLARTLDSAGGQYTPEQYQFFVGTGIPSTLLDYLPSMLEAHPIRLFSCFISYADADSAFAERLHRDLRDMGVRCWKYDVDALIGRGVWQNIDAAISLHEKSIVICSTNSLNRPGILREIERALQREDRLKAASGEKDADTDVLVPVRLDDYVLSSWRHARRADVVAKHIGDFVGWETDEDYNSSFRRMLRALDPRSRIGLAENVPPGRAQWERAESRGSVAEIFGWEKGAAMASKARSPKRKST